MKTALVCGAGGFIGSHMVKRLKNEGYWVKGVDLKYPEFSPTEADDFMIGDLRDTEYVTVPSTASSTKSISLLPIWGAPVLFLPVRMMPILCIIR